MLNPTGVFGPVPGSLLKQVGRGYTDLAAALLAAGLGASELQIWKEVDGIFTADPRKVSTARLIPVISPEEAAELTYYGSEVIHPFTMEQARSVTFKTAVLFLKTRTRSSGGRSPYGSKTSKIRAAVARSSNRKRTSSLRTRRPPLVPRSPRESWRMVGRRGSGCRRRLRSRSASLC